MLKDNQKLRKFFTSDEVVIIVMGSLPVMVFTAWILYNFNFNHGKLYAGLFGCYSVFLAVMIYFIDYFEDGIH